MAFELVSIWKFSLKNCFVWSVIIQFETKKKCVRSPCKCRISSKLPSMMTNMKWNHSYMSKVWYTYWNQLKNSILWVKRDLRKNAHNFRISLYKKILSRAIFFREQKNYLTISTSICFSVVILPSWLGVLGRWSVRQGWVLVLNSLAKQIRATLNVDCSP